MVKNSHEKREKSGFKARQPVHYAAVSPKKKTPSNTIRIVLGIVFIVIVAVAASFALSSPPASNQQTQDQAYPQNVAPTNYMLASISTDGNEVTIPQSYVNSSKLVFIDLKLREPAEILEYQGRTIPLAYYRGGQYLPLVIISTPSGNTVGGIRTCEPCGSFSFHIVKGTNLKCDTCGAEWRLEDFAPVSGGCAAYPPPKLSTTIKGDNVQIDLTPLNLQYLA